MVISTAPFRRERDMLPLLRDALAGFFALRDGVTITTIAELSLDSAIPDLLVGIWRGAESGVPQVPRSRRTTLIEAHILAALEAGPSHRDQLIAALYLTPWAADRALGRLCRAGIVRSNPEGALQLASTGFTAEVEIVAIENKLARWRDALRQASVYRNFADRAYVVLDGNRARTTPVMHTAFVEAGVGLIRLCQHTALLEVPAKAARPLSAERVIAADRLAAAGRADGTASTFHPSDPAAPLM